LRKGGILAHADRDSMDFRNARYCPADGATVRAKISFVNARLPHLRYLIALPDYVT
jgi:hypothetical protein